MSSPTHPVSHGAQEPKSFMPDLGKVTEGKPMRDGVDEPYEADQESNGIDSVVRSANSSADSLEVWIGSESESDGQHQATFYQVVDSGKKFAPVTILSERMDESYLEAEFCCADSDDTTNLHPVHHIREASNPYDADQSSEPSNDVLSEPHSRYEELKLPESHYTIPIQTSAYPWRNNFSQCYGSYDPAPLMVTPSEQSPASSMTVEASSDPGSASSGEVTTAQPASVPRASVYERLTGSRRTSPTAQGIEGHKTTMTQPYGVTWTYSEGPFDHVSTAPQHPEPMVLPTGHASRLEMADRISSVQNTAPPHPTTPQHKTEKVSARKSEGGGDILP
ncbi:MAG: hypothetical protein Q9166_003151 [cf. Caloplaca sp. 2 TL-2023]